MYYKEEFQNLIQQFDKKQSEKLQLPFLMRIIEKLEEKSIEDANIQLRFEEMKTQLEKTKEEFKGNRSIFVRDMKALMEYLRKNHDLVAKGHYSMTYMMYGMAIGVTMGVALMGTGNTSFLAIGIGAGLAIGYGSGEQKEKQVKQAGNLY